jgi:signal transduction histidine kinase
MSIQQIFHFHCLDFWAHYKALEKILLNLLSNASKFTPKGGAITVTISKNNQNAYISVKDTGIGIAADQQNSIFQNFKQITGSRVRKDQGLGLGLAIVKSLVKEMGGTISVESEAGTGSDFILTLPLADKKEIDKWKNKPDNQNNINEVCDNSLLTNEANKADIFKVAAARELEDTTPNNKSDNNFNYKMLIIDDEPDMNDYLAQIFQNEYKITKAINATQGIEKALKETPDIILLDLMLPDINGIEACKKIRQEASLADAKIIVLTARREERFRIDAIAAGANDFIGKPFSDIEIITRINGIKKSIIKRKKLQETLRKLQEALKDLKGAQSKLVQNEKLKTLGELSAGILHEMSNHLNYPRLYAYQLQNDLESNPKLKNKADAIYEGVVRVEEVMTGIRQFTSGAKTHPSLLDLNKIINQAEHIIAQRAEHIKIENKIKKEHKILGVAPEILNLFLNLFINSIDALNEAGKDTPVITISAFKKNTKLYISFKDNGCGIPPKNLNKIFQAFYTTKPSEKGMGLGLSIVEATIKRHKGEIKANSKQGEFTEFIFDLPL